MCDEEDIDIEEEICETILREIGKETGLKYKIRPNGYFLARDTGVFMEMHVAMEKNHLRLDSKRRKAEVRICQSTIHVMEKEINLYDPDSIEKASEIIKKYLSD